MRVVLEYGFLTLPYVHVRTIRLTNLVNCPPRFPIAPLFPFLISRRMGPFLHNSFNTEHNHDLSPSKARYFKCNRILNPSVKRQIIVNDIAGIRPSQSYSSLAVEAGGYENLSFVEKDCRNFLNKARHLRLGQGGAEALRDYFTKMQSRNNGFYSVMDFDDESRLRNVFWADGRSRASYESFGDVVTFDTTYLTNKYGMPFAPFVGVNHHGQSILFGAGLLSSEDTNNFVWLFQDMVGMHEGQSAGCNYNRSR
ncbi:hypothetical protein SLA2020_414910 [Shorea laevis]